MPTTAVDPRHLELSQAWVEHDPHARWRSAAALGAGTGAGACGASILEIPRGCILPRHTDSAEEVVVVVEGEAEISVADETLRVRQGGVALIPKDAPHEVRNAGPETLRFVAVYGAPEVTTTYESLVQPSARRERKATA